MNALLQATAGYFSAIAQVSGGLLGLVFVAVSFNTKALGADGSPVLRNLARQTFADFLAVLMIALFMLLPVDLGIPLGPILAVIAVAGAARIVRCLLVAIRTGERRPLVLQRFGLSLVGHTFLLAAGLLASRNEIDMHAFGGLLVSAPLMLLISGSRSAWILFVHE